MWWLAPSPCRARHCDTLYCEHVDRSTLASYSNVIASVDTMCRHMLAAGNQAAAVDVIATVVCTGDVSFALRPDVPM